VTATLVAIPAAVLTGVVVSWFSATNDRKVTTAPPSKSPVVVSGPAAVPLGGTAGSTCRALVKALPHTLGGRAARRVVPAGATGRAAAWGDPAVVLRCGVGRPAVASGPAQVYSLDGVSWLTGAVAEGGLRWTLVGRAVAVRVDVPADLAEESGATLIRPLAASIVATVPG
jgi:hypothetical protein